MIETALLLLSLTSAPDVAPYTMVAPIGIAEARWTNGLWAQRFETLRNDGLFTWVSKMTRHVRRDEEAGCRPGVFAAALGRLCKFQ